MSHTFGKMATALVGVARTHRAEDYTVTPTMEVTIPEIGLKLTFEHFGFKQIVRRGNYNQFFIHNFKI